MSLRLQDTRSLCKHQLYLYTLGEKKENPNLKTVLFIIEPKNIKICKNEVKYMQDLYAENYKVLMNEDLNKWDDIPWHVFEDSVLPQIHLQIQSIPNQKNSKMFLSWHQWVDSKINKLSKAKELKQPKQV